jgi:hypothetical protein
MPGWLIAFVAAGIVIVIAAIVAITMVPAPGGIPVPAVTGLAESEARGALQHVGLTMQTGGTRYSIDVRQGDVISQEPSAGTLLTPGDAVVVIVSAGAETVIVPGLVGAEVESARRDLSGLGLAVAVQTVESTAAAGTVLELVPAAGTVVDTGSVIRLIVAGRSVSSEALVPYPMDGISVMLDAVAVDSDLDPTREVERRLRSLLEASGAEVAVTRRPAGKAADAGTRARAVVATSATVVVSLDARISGAGGIEVLLLARDLASTTSKARRFADAVSDASRSLDQSAAKLRAVEDTVLASAPCPALRIVLGSVADTKDAQRFGDATWLDSVAQALYRSIGTVFAANGSN